MLMSQLTRGAMLMKFMFMSHLQIQSSASDTWHRAHEMRDHEHPQVPAICPRTRGIELMKYMLMSYLKIQTYASDTWHPAHEVQGHEHHQDSDICT